MDQTNLPKLTPTNSNQVLIHPEHAQGSLVVPKIKQQTHPHHSINIFAMFAIVGLLIVLLLGYFYIPRTRTVMFASTATESLEGLNTEIESVSTSLELLYSSLTGSSAAEDGELSEIRTGVLGANTSASTNFLSANSLSLIDNFKNALQNQGLVKGFSVPESDPNKAVRDQRNLAEGVSEKANRARTLLSTQLLALTEENLPSKADPLQDQLKSLHGSTDEYLSEAEKTSKYYVALSDASIEIYNISVSLNEIKDIDNAIVDLTKVRDGFAKYEPSKLPEQIEPLNQDVVAIFDLLINFFKEFNSSNEANILNSYTNFINETRTLGVQTQTHELNFWQNNKALSSSEDLSNKYTNTLNQAKQVKTDNQYFLLPMLGVK